MRKWLARAFAGVIQSAADKAVEHVGEEIVAGAFDERIEQVIVETTRQHDVNLTRVGFILKITVELIDRSQPQLQFKTARSMAQQVYDQFRRDNGGVKFGAPGWDWSGAGARELAHEYEIAHWEPSP